MHHTATAGGRVRFITDSPYVAISIKLSRVTHLPNFSLLGSAGLDMYVRENGKEIYSGSFAPPVDTTGHFEKLVEFKNNQYATPQKKLRINQGTVL